jgi:hypothetical protein
VDAVTVESDCLGANDRLLDDADPDAAAAEVEVAVRVAFRAIHSAAALVLFYMIQSPVQLQLKSQLWAIA